MSGAVRFSRELYVEGKDEEHAIGQILVRNGFDPAALPEFKEVGGKDQVLAAIPIAVRVGTGRARYRRTEVGNETTLSFPSSPTAATPKR